MFMCKIKQNYNIPSFQQRALLQHFTEMLHKEAV